MSGRFLQNFQLRTVQLVTSLRWLVSPWQRDMMQMEISHSSSITATMATYCPKLMAPLGRWKMWVSLLLNILKDENSLCTRPSATLTTTYPVALLRLGNLILSICFFYQRMLLTLFFRICEAVYIRKSVRDVFWWKFHLCISWFHTFLQCLYEPANVDALKEELRRHMKPSRCKAYLVHRFGPLQTRDCWLRR